jgi:AraC-like DNA-binding protein
MDEKPALYKIDTVDDFNKLYGFETKHPLVAVVDMSRAQRVITGTATFSYGLYALFLKQTYCGDITYGRQPYDYQEGTVASYAPGQAITVSHRPDYTPNALGVLFHPDLIRGTELGKDIGQYSFFSYDVREALHLSEEEKGIFSDCLAKMQTELNHSIDNHSRKLICRNIQLLLDYCMRFYERQFITRHCVNHDVLTRFEQLLNSYFADGRAAKEGLPTVRHFAEECYLSPNYFGDLVKKETGRTPQELIQSKIISTAKEELAATGKTVGEVAWHLGFQYPQHFNRFFKRNTGMTPSEYRSENRQRL